MRRRRFCARLSPAASGNGGRWLRSNRIPSRLVLNSGTTSAKLSRKGGFGFLEIAPQEDNLLSSPLAEEVEMEQNNRFVTTSIEGFLQQLAARLLPSGYWFYVRGIVPKGKDPEAVDEKLTAKYDIVLSKFTRCRRKKAGLANLQYLRHDRYFLLLATHGRHDFFEEEKDNIRDARKTPIVFASYAIGYRGGHSQVRIERETYRDIKAYFLENARRSQSFLERTFFTLPFEPYSPVRTQLFLLHRRVNRIRRESGLEELSQRCLRVRRRIVKPFEIGHTHETTRRRP